MASFKNYPCSVFTLLLIRHFIYEVDHIFTSHKDLSYISICKSNYNLKNLYSQYLTSQLALVVQSEKREKQNQQKYLHLFWRS